MDTTVPELVVVTAGELAIVDHALPVILGRAPRTIEDALPQLLAKAHERGAPT